MKFEPFERDSNQSKANSIHSKGIRSVQMQIRTIRTGYEAFECKFERFERDSKRSNAISNPKKGIRSVRMELNSSHSKGIRSDRTEIRTIQKGFEEFECKF